MAIRNRERREAPGLSALASRSPPSRAERWRIAVTLLVLPLVIALVLWFLWLRPPPRRWHNGRSDFCFAAVSVGLPVVCSWVPGRNAGRSGATSADPGSVVSYGPVTAVQLVHQQPDVAGKPVSLGPRPTLAGRDDLLANLDTKLSAGDGPWPRIAVLYGLGGVGKTSVAVEYAHRHPAEVRVAWATSRRGSTALTAEFGDASRPARDASSLRSAGPGDIGTWSPGRAHGRVAAGVGQRAGSGHPSRGSCPQRGPGGY